MRVRVVARRDVLGVGKTSQPSDSQSRAERYRLVRRSARRDVGSSRFRCCGRCLCHPIDRTRSVSGRKQSSACRPDVIPTSAVALQSIERRAAIVCVGVRARSAGHSVVCRHGRSCLQGGRFTARVERLKMRLQAGEKIPDVAVELREITDGVQHLLQSGLI